MEIKVWKVICLHRDSWGRVDFVSMKAFTEEEEANEYSEYLDNFYNHGQHNLIGHRYADVKVIEPKETIILDFDSPCKDKYQISHEEQWGYGGKK